MTRAGPRRGPLVVLLAISMLTVGCIGGLGDDTDERAGDNSTTHRVEADGVDLVVTVLNLTRSPLTGAEVTVATDQATLTDRTGELGTVRVGPLEEGRAVVEARTPGYQGRTVTLELPDEGEVHETLVLRPAQEATTFVQSHEFHGLFECSATYLIITGDCLAPVEFAANEAGLPYDENATNDRYTFPFDLGAGWTQLEIVQTWQDPVAGAGNMMRVNLEPIDSNNTGGHSPRYARAEGPSPVHLVLDNDGQPAETASDDEMILPEEGGTVRTRTFHLGFQETHNPGGTEFLGTGAAIEQAFTVYVNVTYGGR